MADERITPEQADIVLDADIDKIALQVSEASNIPSWLRIETTHCC